MQISAPWPPLELAHPPLVQDSNDCCLINPFNVDKQEEEQQQN